MLGVRLLDGRMNPLVEVRVQVGKPGETPNQIGPGMIGAPPGFRREIPLPNYPLFSTAVPKGKLYDISPIALTNKFLVALNSDF